MTMEIKKITAIIRSDLLEKVEERLKTLGIKGVSVSNVKGYGEYMNFFRHDWMVTHTRIEIFVEKRRAAAIVAAVLEVAHTGVPGDGVLAVSPIEYLYRIRTMQLAEPEEV